MIDMNPANGGVPMQSTLYPDTLNYLRYFYIENVPSDLNTKFAKTIMSLDGIGTVTKVDADVLEHMVYKNGVNHDNFCGKNMNTKYMFSSAGVTIPKSKLRTDESYGKTNFNALFIISGASANYYLLHSVITFNVSLYHKDNKSKILTIDSFCAYQKQDKDDIGIDNPGGRLLFDVINRACKKMKIKRIELDAIDEAKPWYKSKGFEVNISKSDSDQLSKNISHSPEVDVGDNVGDNVFEEKPAEKTPTKHDTKPAKKSDEKTTTKPAKKSKTAKKATPVATMPWWRRIFSRRR